MRCPGAVLLVAALAGCDVGLGEATFGGGPAAVTGSGATSSVGGSGPTDLPGGTGPGTGGSTETGCNPVCGEEDCTNGKDDSGDDLEDCADPACSPTFECVSSPPGYILGTVVQTGTACPEGTSNIATVFPAAAPVTGSCTGCSCGTSMPEVQVKPVLGACPGGSLGGNVATVGPGFCDGFTDPITNNSAYVSISSTDDPKGMCLSSGGSGTLPPLTPPGPTYDFCKRTEPTGAGCSPTEACVPKGIDQLCIFATDNRGCPPGFTPFRGPWYASFVDNRTCGPCTCSRTADGSLGVKICKNPCAIGPSSCRLVNEGEFGYVCGLGSGGGDYVQATGAQIPPVCDTYSALTGNVAGVTEQTVCCR